MRYDSHKKSALKSIIWRLLGVLVLAIITYLYTRSLFKTSLITFTHHGSFLLIFYLHERAWLKVRMKFKHIVKTFTYEIILGNLVLGTITWFITGSWLAVTGITLTYIGIKVIMYPIYDKVWTKKIVYVYMVGDIIHSGHLEHLRNAKRHGRVVVGVLTKEAVMEKKPEPIFSLSERMNIISALRDVDIVMTQSTYSPLENVKAVKPDILMETTDHLKQPANNLVKSYGGKVIITQVPNSTERKQSSTKIKNEVIRRQNLLGPKI